MQTNNPPSRHLPNGSGVGIGSMVNTTPSSSTVSTASPLTVSKLMVVSVVIQVAPLPLRHLELMMEKIPQFVLVLTTFVKLHMMVLEPM